MALALAILEGLLFLLGQRTPHLAELLSDSAEANIGILFLDLGAVLLGEEHETRERLLSLGGLLGLWSKTEAKTSLDIFSVPATFRPQTSTFLQYDCSCLP